MPTIKYDKPTTWRTLGYSGYTKARGLEVCEFDDEVLLEPINSRGDVGRARLVVPVAHLKELRDALDAIIAKQEHPAKPANCRAPDCSLPDRSDGRCCGYMEA